MGNAMSKKLLLITHPSLDLVAEQLTMPADVAGRYGEYTGQKLGKVITDKGVHNVDEIFEVVSIAPERMERVSSELGRVTIVGITREGEQATVDIDPFTALDSLGTIMIGEQLDTD
jgi:hypothetical protein